MKKVLKKILVTYILILSTCFNLVVYADEVKLEIGCNLSFEVIDESKLFDGKIKVIMKDEKGSIEEYTLTKANSWGKNKIPKYTVPQGTYSITFEGIGNDYSIVNYDNTEITKFKATKDGYDFKWKILSNKSTSKIVDDTNLDLNLDLNNSTSNSNISLENSRDIGNLNPDTSNVKTNNEEADKVFNEFLETVKFIETDPKWVDFLELYDLYADTPVISYAQEYADFVSGGTKEKFLEMSLFDRFIYEETYLRLANFLSMGDWDYYFSTEENFRENITRSTVTLINAYDRSNTIASDAYQKLMDWQYDYIKEHNAPYDFITGLNYLESKGKKADPEKEKKDKEKAEVEEIEEVIKEIKKEEKGIWDDTLILVAKNGIAFVLVIILIIAIIIVIYIKKKNNINDTNVK